MEDTSTPDTEPGLLSEEEYRKRLTHYTQQHALPDDFLQTLVLMANHGVSMGITVTVGGSFISGTLIGGAQFFEEFQQKFSVASEQLPGFAPELDSVWQSFKARYPTPPSGQEDKREAKDLRSVAFLHLKDVVVFNGAGAPIRIDLWRGRLSEIAGFSFGQLQYA